MANANRSNLIRIYGVTLAEKQGRIRPYGHGMEKFEEHLIQYVDYFIEDLIALIKNQGLKEKIIGLLQNGKTI